MKRIIIAIALIAVFSLQANGDFQFENISNKLIVHYENEESQQDVERPSKVVKNTSLNPVPQIDDSEDIYKMIALPCDEVEILVDNCQTSIYSKKGELLQRSDKLNENCVELVKSYIMRELKAHQIKIKTEIEKDDMIIVLDKLDFEIIPKAKMDLPDGISPAFLPIYKALVDNFDNSYLTDISIRPSKMLIITHQDLLTNPIVAPYFEKFVSWKEAKGISVAIATIDTIGNTTLQIKNYIQNAYDTWEMPPDYLLLIGDVNDDYAIPSYYIGADNDVTDHPYTLLEGNDYFPEMLVGRISIDNITDLMTITCKILSYEKEPPLAEPGWLTRAFVIAGNYSTSPPQPSTPVKVSRWLREKLLNFGYTQVDTLFRYGADPSGTEQIATTINNGVGFVNYRGWGDANGWHYPEFHIDDVSALSNGILPVITSFVCNTGDFANTWQDPCFGEAWLRLGMPSRGGVIFLGPSDLHTSTKYNNSICSGFYYGLLDENILTFGSAVLRGKLELFNNFPLDREQGDDVEFYFHVYNILGDPSLSMWTKIPDEINCDLPDEISIGTNYLELNLPDMDDGIATARKGDEFYTAEVIENGQALLYVAPQTEGDMEVVITKGNYIPFIDTISVVSEAIDVGLSSYNIVGDDIVNPRDNIALEITLQNYGTQQANSVYADLSTNNPFINITSNSANFGNIAPSATAIGNYQFEAMANCPDNEILEFTLNISTGNTAKFEILVRGLAFEIDTVIVNDDNGILDPGEEREITVSIENIGYVDAVGLLGTLSSYTDAVIVTNANANFGDIAVSGIGQANFTLMAQSDCFVGRNANFRIDFVDGNGLFALANFSLELGEVDSTAPTGPDSYGYFAYDSNDIDYSECPTYVWYEIDPELGGSGTVIQMGDDVSHTVGLPFDFTYYGATFDSITICSNGWISFEPTWMTNFRNWNIPSALGPYAMVAPYWDDLQGVDGTMRICYYYHESEDIFIIEWNDCLDHDLNYVEKFELILFDPAVYHTEDGNGEVQFNYHTINNPDYDNNYATVGIENLDQSDGLLYTYANIYPASATPLENELAIKFTTDPPDNYVGIDDNEMCLTPGLKLYQNYPNPFSTKSGNCLTTTIKFQIPSSINENLFLKIYNIKGELVRTFECSESLAIEPTESVHSIVWNGKDMNNKEVSSGIYFYRLQTKDKSITKKMILLR